MEPHLKIVLVGHVDHGKSTLIGRLFHDTGSLPAGRYEQLAAAAKRRGMPFEWANLMDGLQAERDQNVTIDTAQIWFKTPKRQVVLIDAPGHKEFLKNMVTGAASAEAALLLIAANEGVQEQSRRHGTLLQMLGLRQIAVLVNKMDLVGWKEEAFREVERQYRAFLSELGLSVRRFIPISAKEGDNLVKRSERMKWYQDATVVETLDGFHGGGTSVDRPLRFPIQDVYRFDERRLLVGRVDSGRLKVGDKLLFSPRNKLSSVKTIERWSAPPSDRARAGESVAITLSEQIFVERGQVGSHEEHAPIETDVFNAKLFWLGRRPLEVGVPYKLKLATQEIECRVQSIQKIIDASTLAEIPGAKSLGKNDVAELTLRTKAPVTVDDHERVPATGRFVVVDGGTVAGGGIIHQLQYPDRRPALSGIKSSNITWTQGEVTRADRQRLRGQKGAVIWLTGLSGSGKSTIAVELEKELFAMGKLAYYLDGDNIRHGLSSDLGFSPEDRQENIRRVGEVAKLFVEAGTVVITAFISPYQDDRRRVRSILGQGDFVEVFVDCPIEVCEQRDPRGLYKKARAGQIKEFTGVSAPYEPPEDAEVVLRTDKLSIPESVAKILDYLKKEHLDAR